MGTATAREHPIDPERISVHHNCYLYKCTALILADLAIYKDCYTCTLTMPSSLESLGIGKSKHNKKQR